jgi:endonuclease/exonuclease/phosphatase family metal-dependent hydrolase
VATATNRSFLSILKWPFLAANFIFVLLLLLSYLAYHVRPVLVPVLPFFGMAYPYILLGHLLFIVFWLIFRMKYALISAVFIAAGWNHVDRLIQLRPGSESDPDTKGFTLVSYNVQNLIKANMSTTKYITDFQNQARIISFLKEIQPGVVCLQEFLYDREDVKGFPGRFGKEIGCPHYHFENYYEKTKNKIDAIATFSKYPVVGKGLLMDAEKRFGIYTDLVIDNDTVRVFNLHLASIHFRQEDYQFFGDIATQPEQEKIRIGLMMIISKMKAAFIKRNHQVDQLKERFRQSPYPIIICADLNDTPSSWAYNKIRNTRKDAFIVSGSGIGKTYAEDFFPAFRIDYIFHDPVFVSSRFVRHKIHLSDHYPVSCIITRSEMTRSD